ncbi:MAG: MBL fold metallo-hydrolase [Halioglobus sp.]|nr:MBL fold metallo-hydrolase [Halioglobus sp.]|tara:strand:- start:358 stop:1116 length:759 start_codon:yes stop_codon:yes gene_type:complete
MQIASLGSGSRGNGTLVRAGSTLVLVDCGFSLRETTRRMARLGVEPGDLDAVLVTHEHGDHASGVAGLARKHKLPVYLTHGTLGSGRLDGADDYRCFNCGETLPLGELSVQTVAVPHDAAEPCQFRFDWRQRSLGILTDLGSVTPHVVQSFRDCRLLMLEFNHDLETLMHGEYPPHLKRRVGGDWGHLNNQQAVDLLRQLNAPALAHLVVAHVSEKNNRRELAEEALLSVLDSLDRVVFACQAEGFGWLQVD